MLTIDENLCDLDENLCDLDEPSTFRQFRLDFHNSIAILDSSMGRNNRSNSFNFTKSKTIRHQEAKDAHINNLELISANTTLDNVSSKRAYLVHLNADNNKWLAQKSQGSSDLAYRKDYKQSNHSFDNKNDAEMGAWEIFYCDKACKIKGHQVKKYALSQCLNNDNVRLPDISEFFKTRSRSGRWYNKDISNESEDYISERTICIFCRSEYRMVYARRLYCYCSPF